MQKKKNPPFLLLQCWYFDLRMKKRVSRGGFGMRVLSEKKIMMMSNRKRRKERVGEEEEECLFC